MPNNLRARAREPHELEKRWIEEYRKREHGISREEFGAFFGRSGTFVSQVEQGRRHFGVVTLAVIRVRYPQWQGLIDQYLVDIGTEAIRSIPQS